MPPSQTKYAWYRDLNRYQWFVLGVACTGWMFDSMAQQIFGLARRPAIQELLGAHATSAAVSQQSGYATSVFLIGWATGGILFGILGDRLGRVRTMMLAILSYTVFTGLSTLATGVWDFDVYRFLCGLGVGGQFAVGVAIVAEVVPERARPYALGTIQAFSPLGNILAAFIGIGLGWMEQGGVITGAWRYLFLAGALPAPLAILVFMKLKEPEQWLKARAQKVKLGSYKELFSVPRWRRNAIAGLLLSVAGVVGLWGIGYFSYDLFRQVLERSFRAQGLTGAALAGKTTTWIGVTSMFQNLGGFFGVYAFTYLTHYTGRRMAFAVSFVAAMCATAYTFWHIKAITDIFWMVPMMGFSQLMLFGGYAIYLPELFPTRMRATGMAFAFNSPRFIAFLGPLFAGLLISQLGGFSGMAVAFSFIYILGFVLVPFLPETKGKPLPA